jgi:hypothetical protein
VGAADRVEGQKGSGLGKGEQVSETGRRASSAGLKSVKDWKKNWLRQLWRVRKTQFWRVFHLEGGSGRNYKTDREKVLSIDKLKPICMGSQTICHNREHFQDLVKFGNQKCYALGVGGKEKENDGVNNIKMHYICAGRGPKDIY